MSAVDPYYGIRYFPTLAALNAEKEYLSWAPDEFWSGRQPGELEYQSWYVQKGVDTASSSA